MKTFLIAGSIVDTDADRETFEDVTPTQVNAFINKLDDGEDIEVDITSYGGSVAAGVAICNLLKQASANGHKTKSHVIGIAASMASAIACACDEMTIDANAFWMCHLPWTMSIGNAVDLRKEAEVLDTYRDALVAIYKSKFDTTSDVIVNMMESETWILGNQAPMFKMNAEVIPTQEPLRVAAFAKQMPKFMHTPKALKDIIMEKEQELKSQDDLTTKPISDMENKETDKEQDIEKEVQEAVETAEVEAENPVEQASEAQKEDEQPVEEMVAKAEVDKRVSGMQSTMAKKMDAMKKDYEAKIADFEVQMKAKDEELAKAKADATSFKESLDAANGELSKLTSALEEKSNALAALNASVNTPNEQTNWKALKGQEFFDWYSKNH